MKIGVDIVEVERFKTLLTSDTFFNKYFSVYEREYILSKSHPAETMAGIFASKEAFLKALGIGIGRGIDLKDIEIKHDDMGKPYIYLTEKLLSVIKNTGATGVDISISHTATVATATCILF